MTLAEIKALVAAIDQESGHYESACQEGDSYTTWRERNLLPLMADDQHQEGWRFQIDRFTKDEDDEVARRIRAALDADDGVAYEYQVDYEQDTGYIHHIFACEGV